MKNCVLFYLLPFLFLFSISCSTKDAIVVKELRCEYAINPIAVDVQQPRFSWILESPLRGQKQTAFQVLVSGNKEKLKKENGDLWDSGKVVSDQTVNIRYAGAPLKSNQACYWKVRVWDKDGTPSKYSKPVAFSMALLRQNDWKAHWIGLAPVSDPNSAKGYYSSPSQQPPGKDSVHVDSRSTLLRKELAINKRVKNARVYVSGLGLYELHVNGEKVGDKVLTPAKTNYHEQVLYDTYDITKLLQKGTNAVGIMIGNGWFNPTKKWWDWHMQWFGAKRAILQLHLAFEDGTSQIFASDGTWKASAGAVVKSCIYDGEVYDANLEKPGWDQPGYDDSDWENASIANAPAGKMISQMMEPVKINATIKPVAMTKPKAGVVVYDMGQNFAGWAKISVRGDKGTKVVLQYAENLGDNGLIDPMTNNRAKATDVYILKGDGVENYEPHFTFHGFRYVQLSAIPALPQIVNLQGCVVHSACETVGHFETGNAVINKIHKATLWSQRSNMLGYPSDCPQRDERLGWMGDAHVTAEEAMHNFHTPLFYRNWLSGIRSNQDKTGDISIISPRPYMDPGTIAWSSAYILIPWYYYLHYGDVEILATHFDSMKRYFEFLQSTAKNYILPHDKYGDWVSVAPGWQGGKPESAATGYYFYDALLLSKAAQVLGKTDEAQHFAALADEIRKAYNRRFFYPEKNQYENGSQMSNAFPLFLGIVPRDHEAAVLQSLVDNIVKENKGHLTTGILGTKYMMQALAKYNRNDIAFLLATQTDYPGWFDMVKNRTTLSEHWDQGGSNNHVMFGSVDAWFYRTLAGINVDETQPGYKKIVVKPFVNPALSPVKASLKTVRGEIKSAWTYENGVYKLNVTIPVNATADVYILAKNAEQVTENKGPAASSPGVRFLRRDGNYAVFAVGSGTYRFVSKEVGDLVIPPYAATPEIFPLQSFVMAGDTVTVNMSSLTKNAVIRYTLDGSEPTEDSQQFQKPFLLKSGTVVKAKSFKQGYHPSYTRSVHYAFVDAQKNGLNYEIYAGAFIHLPDFSSLKPGASGRTYQIALSGLNTPKYNFAVKFSGLLEIARPGKYIFSTTSNDGSRLFINNQLVVDNDGEHGVEERNGAAVLQPGKYPITVSYFQSGGSQAFDVYYQGPGIEKQHIPASMLFLQKEK
ncbi:MAG: family 78 glycoside hydrolase catalytic domain [Calditrichaeota bacterium]|nr:family 78 glycoside hydrolase catalytic domain [Calditrichota bacterium]